MSGVPLSSWQTRGRIDAAPSAAGDANPVPLIALEPRDRAWLHRRIAERFQAMLDAGLVDEVAALRRRGDLHPDLPAMRAVGYRQAWAALEAGRLECLHEEGTAATRQLAKRQLTWLRSFPGRHCLACDDPDVTGRAVLLARQLIEPTTAPGIAAAGSPPEEVDHGRA